jgi:uncharacterized protein with ParB-like and HNH nuclease domain
MNKTTFKSIREYFSSGNQNFIIPNYQRGFKWSVKNNDDLSAVEKLCDDLINAAKDQNYFLQGVTVCEEGDQIILIDGQQRTTTLYLILWFLEVDFFNKITLKYDVREKSKEFISKLKETEFDYKNFDSKNSNQDIFYFKKAIEQIENKLGNIEKDLFTQFLLEKVNVLYITISKEKATKTFTMMNGAKATMLQEELIKSEILRQISIPLINQKSISTSIDENLSELKNIISIDWETNAKRSRYAREWDKWLYWWNQKEVQIFFNTEKPLGFLLQFYFYKDQFIHADTTFIQFKELLNSMSAIQIFKKLRDLQKSFEDIFKEPKSHNYLKLSLLCSSGLSDVFDIINFFFLNKAENDKLKSYAQWRLVGATHREITKEKELGEDEERKEQKAHIVMNNLSDRFLYNNFYDIALKQLLRLNVEEDNKLFNGKGRKFDFSIYGNKSLEHIHPKSKVFHSKKVNENDLEKILYYDGNNNLLNDKPYEKQWLDRGLLKDCTEHSIGNLVLLDKNENSKFNDKPFDKKKDIYFNVNEGFKSRNLLHSIAVFAKSSWIKDDIEDNQNKFLTRFKKDYGISE